MLKEQIASFLKAQSVEPEKFQVGAAFGHFLVYNTDLTAVKYDGEDGIASLLEYMERNGWEGIYEEDEIIGVRKEKATVLLKCGGQLEFQMAKTDHLQEIDQAYLDFIQGLFDELKARKQMLLSIGYQPVSKAEDIPVVPMVKYQYLQQYLADNKEALEYEKAASTVRVVIDYAHSDDFERKFRVATALSPVFSALFDNVPMWSGTLYKGYVGSVKLRNHYDKKISYIGNVMNENAVYKFDQYADFIAKMPAVAVNTKEATAYVGAASNRDAYETKTINNNDIISMLNMCQADVRVTEEGIELSMVDALPYPLNMAFVALIKGLFYNIDQLAATYDLVQHFKQFDIDAAKLNIVENGMNTKYGEGTVRELAKDLFFMATPTLSPQEQHYIQPLDAIIFKEICPKDVAARQLEAMLNQ